MATLHQQRHLKATMVGLEAMALRIQEVEVVGRQRLVATV
jgi:hypothetical protein